jgi:hypothetical protein
MKRLIDLLLIVLLLGAGGIGAYFIGHRVDHLSNQAASQDSELNGTTTTAVHHAHTIAGRHITPLLVGEVLLGVLLIVVVIWLVAALANRAKRERWRVS